jgi:alpha-glucosidase
MLANRKISVLTGAAFLIVSASAQPPARDPEGHRWWQHSVFYEIYPRSFADSNSDGVGDLKGIASRLDYLRWLGVDAIWLTPMFPSPQVDFGYDVSDYENVNPEYGTLSDMDRLIAEGRNKNVRVLLDFVMNHTSDRHPWFIESESSRTDPKRDWYMWRDGKRPGWPPNNWVALFGGPAWKFDSKTGQWYYHYFYPEQPDLNWRNPAVEKAMFDVTRWWYRRGIAGFRLDAVDTLFEDPQLRDNPVVDKEKNAYGDPKEENVYNLKLPEVQGVLRRLRRVADESDAVLIGETYTRNIGELKEYYGARGDELQMPMDMMFGTVDKVSAPEFRRQIALVEATGAWPVYVLGNHDLRRIVDRYGDGQHNDQAAKLMGALQLTLRGTPILYYGEEIGMENNDPKRREDVKDPIGKLGWPKEKGRDGERTPMQWDASQNAGFSKARPWLPVGPRFAKYNVAAEQGDEGSILNFYHRLLTLRHTNDALREGKYVPLNQNDPNVLANLRTYKGRSVLVMLNMSPSGRTFRAENMPAGTATTLLASGGKAIAGGQYALEPFGVYVAEIR